MLNALPTRYPFPSPSALAHGESKRSVRWLQIDRLILRLTPSSITFIRKAFLRALPSVLNATAAETSRLLLRRFTKSSDKTRINLRISKELRMLWQR